MEHTNTGISRRRVDIEGVLRELTAIQQAKGGPCSGSCDWPTRCRPIQALQPAGAAIPVLQGMKVLQAAPVAESGRYLSPRY